jgi:hypothetical protein
MHVAGRSRSDGLLTMGPTLPPLAGAFRGVARRALTAPRSGASIPLRPLFEVNFRLGCFRLRGKVLEDGGGDVGRVMPLGDQSVDEYRMARKGSGVERRRDRLDERGP